MGNSINWPHLIFKAIFPLIAFLGIIAFLMYIYTVTPEQSKHEFYLSASSSIASWAAAVIAYYGLIYAGDTLARSSLIAKQQSTINMVMEFNNDEKLQRVKNEIFKNSQDLTLKFCLLPEDEKGEELRDEYYYVLNRYEFVSLGIRVGAFDEELYKNLQCSNILKIWNAVQPLVSEIRKKNKKPTLYQELEWLNNRWTNNPIKKIVVEA